MCPNTICIIAFSIFIAKIYRIIGTIRKHVAFEELGNISRYDPIRVDEPAVGKVVVPALEVVETRFAVVIIATVAQRVDVPDEAGLRNLRTFVIVHGIVAPRAVVVGRGEGAVRVQQRDDIALRVEDVVVELRCLAVLVDHGERLAAIVIDKLERLAAPLLPHDLAGERGVIVRRAVDRFAGTDAGHVVGVGDLLAVHRRGGELAALRPREGIVLAVVVRDGVAGGRDVARPGLAFVENVLGRTVCRHAREQIQPRGIRVAEGLCDRAVFRDAADVARRVVGIAEGRAAAVLLRCKLALRVVAILLRRGRGGHVFNDALHC